MPHPRIYCCLFLSDMRRFVEKEKGIYGGLLQNTKDFLHFKPVLFRVLPQCSEGFTDLRYVVDFIF